ncbi:hypothetical protein D3C84_1196590 [compost metagenome]
MLVEYFDVIEGRGLVRAGHQAPCHMPGVELVGVKIVQRVGGLEDLLAEDPRRLLGHAVPPQFRYGLLALEVASGVPEHRAVLAIRPAL